MAKLPYCQRKALETFTYVSNFDIEDTKDE